MVDIVNSPPNITRPYRFLVTCWPFVGHVYQQMGIASALRAHGHEVAFYTGDQHRRLIEQEGFTAFPFRRVNGDQVCRMVEAMESADPTRRGKARRAARTFREWLVETIPDQVADLEPLIAEWRPDVIVTDLSMWAPIVILWEKTGVPVALSSTFMGPLIPGPDAPPWGLGLAPPRTAGARALARAITAVTELLGRDLRRQLDALRAEHRLGPLGCTINEYTGKLPLYLVGNIPELDYNRRDLPPSVAYVGSCVWNRPTGSETPAWLDTVPVDQPWVHVTESTLRNQDPFLLRAAAQGLKDLPLQVVLTSGKQRDPKTLDLGPLAPNVTVADWVSHGDLLHRCSVVVTNGGAGTIIAALQVGVPVVVVPTTWDKPDNARRVVEAGVGVSISPRRCTPEQLRKAVEQVLSDPGYRARAQEIARRFAAAPGPSGAAALLEELANTEVGTDDSAIPALSS